MQQLAAGGRDDRLSAVETRPDLEILNAIADGQANAIAAVRSVIPALIDAAGILTETWRLGGRVAYAGAGSSGLMALVDALELPGTYGMEKNRIPILLAGGRPSLDHLDGAFEDDREAGLKLVQAHGIGKGDVVLAISASGSTPFTLTVANAAKARGATLIAIAGETRSPLLAIADVAVALATGPELISGSTRMNAGTAQKCALNMLSTLMAMRLNHVYDGMMVNLRPDNAKLQERLAHIVAQVTSVDIVAARRAVDLAQGSGKVAILLAAGASIDAARHLLAISEGDVGAALHAFRHASVLEE